MTIPFWCLLITLLLPYVLAGVGGYYRKKSFGEMDNKDPRTQAAQLEGEGARAYAAQQNAWEALAAFSVAVFIAHLSNADQKQSAIASMLFVITRIIHPIVYIKDIDKARTAVFVLGVVCCLWLLVLSI
jgi:uncharacterized MAPEG superfamily protein